jgi:hypothetical protein
MTFVAAKFEIRMPVPPRALKGLIRIESTPVIFRSDATELPALRSTSEFATGGAYGRDDVCTQLRNSTRMMGV